MPTPDPQVAGWFDAILTTYQFQEHVIGQFPTYDEARAEARKIMLTERDFHPYALRVWLKPSIYKMHRPTPPPSPIYEPDRRENES